MIKSIILSLLLALSVNAQSFTNTVNETVNGNAVFSYNYKVDNDNIVDKPLYFTISFSGNNVDVSAVLTHRGISYNLFEGITPTKNTMVVGPFYDFNGVKQSGEWKLEFDSQSPTYVSYWSIYTIPEPSTTALALVGAASMIILTRKNKK